MKDNNKPHINYYKHSKFSGTTCATYKLALKSSWISKREATLREEIPKSALYQMLFNKTISYLPEFTKYERF